MAFTQADIDALKRAIATGARKVRYESGGEVREVTYRSLDEMERSLAAMEREISGASRPRSVLVSHNRSR
ncbi:phage head-tail joining protein [Rhodomicrobium lacus]|uniref:phage head-tail joining protein n=1 Tax=Rhodomicrobium lacus TaxID=2498452 RepID=UPI000F8EF6E6|nr:hypothetical protein [Rhodomicrobium lacus]